MLLKNKNAVIYGAAGFIGSAVGRAFAREGANLFLAGRTLSKVKEVAEEIAAAGGVAEAAEVDGLDAESIEQHLDAIVRKVGGIDITINAVWIKSQGVCGRPGNSVNWRLG